jgi:hypothetical protein
LVNRIWHDHFGRGIVATPSNFGVRGQPPSHPDLLDWLAATFMAGGWSIKAMHRAIIQSATYQLASDEERAAAAMDPEDRLIWRYPGRRLDAESIRDAMLAISGRLDRSRPGRHPFPPIEEWHWTQHNAFKTVYPTSHRSVYLMTQRLVKHPYLALFDGPDTNASTGVRAQSTVPLQALYLMNNPFVLDCAGGLAGRMRTGAHEPEARITLGYRLAWGRSPGPGELARAIRFLDEAKAAAAAGGLDPRAADRAAWTSLAKVLLTANELLYMD